MNVDYYKRKIDDCNSSISKNKVEISKLKIKLSGLERKELEANAAGARSKQISTKESKKREADRYKVDAAKIQESIRKIEVKVAELEKKISEYQKNISTEELKEKRREESKRKEEELHNRREISKVMTKLSQHESLHRHTLSEIDQIKKLPEKIMVAFFASDPDRRQQYKLSLDEEARMIGKKIRESEHRDAVIIESRWAVRPMDIIQSINELRPSIVHFSGHGSDKGELILQDDSGNPKAVSIEAIASVISTVSECVKLVFFNTCFSDGQAKACAEQVGAAIGMNTSVNDDAAVIFSSQFYSSLGFGHSIKVAFNQAKAALMMEVNGQADIPQLYVKEGILENELVLVRPVKRKLENP